jgi:hypothetical protein
VPHVWGQQDAGYVGVVGEEFADGDYAGQVAAHDHFPDVDVALEGVSKEVKWREPG